jgi:hypothetical protein
MGKQVEGPDPHLVDPVIERCLEVLNEEGILHDRAKYFLHERCAALNEASVGIVAMQAPQVT